MVWKRVMWCTCGSAECYGDRINYASLWSIKIHIPCIFIVLIASEKCTTTITRLYIYSCDITGYMCVYTYIYIYIRFFNSCRRLSETKLHSSLFLHWTGSKFLIVVAACTPSIHVFLGRSLFLLSRGIQSIINFGIQSSGILLTWPYHCSLFCSIISMTSGFLFIPIISFICSYIYIYNTTVSLYIIYSPTWFDISMSSSGSFKFVPCQVTWILKIEAVKITIP